MAEAALPAFVLLGNVGIGCSVGFTGIMTLIMGGVPALTAMGVAAVIGFAVPRGALVCGCLAGGLLVAIIVDSVIPHGICSSVNI